MNATTAAPTTLELIRGGMHPSEAGTIDRDDAIRLIREALKKRSGKAWSVKGGRGTGWGWITVSAPPARCGEYGYMSDADRTELASLLGLGHAHQQGVTIAAASDYRREYVTRALGLEVLDHGTPYWD